MVLFSGGAFHQPETPKSLKKNHEEI
ncbi:MAG: AgrD family cyclic lactone autoinducer peptide [Anaerorhabdus sp.]